MKDNALDLANMTVEDLFQAKTERRLRLTNLPFEQKIQIVKKLQSVYPLTQVGFHTLVDDLLSPICLDLGIQISRVSPAMIPYYVRGQWLFGINQHVVTITRWSFGREESVEGWEDSSFKPGLVFGAELRTAFDKLRTETDEPTQIVTSQAERWRQKLPISYRSFDAANGTWIAEWFADPVFTQNNDHVSFDIKFNRDIPTDIEKRLQIQLHMATLSEDPTNNISLIQPHILALLEGVEAFSSVWFQGEPYVNQ